MLNDVKPPIPGVAPVVTAIPVIVGSPIVGVTLTFTLGSASGTPSPSPLLATWQISANGTTGWSLLVFSQDYTIPAGDATKFYRVLETWTNASGTATGTSAAIGPVTTPVSPPGPVSPPVIS